MKTLSVSQIQTLLSCETKHDYVYRQRLASKTVEDAGAMRLGTVYHEIMSNLLSASFHNNTPEKNLGQLVDWSIKTWDQAKRPLNRTVSMGAGFEMPDTAFYLLWEETLESARIMALLTLEKLDLMNRFEVLGTDMLAPEFRPAGDPLPLVEYKFSYPIEGTDYVFNGVIDAVVRDRNSGHIVVLDWKTKGKFINEDDELMNMQVGLYQYVMRHMGIPVTRGLLYQMRTGIHKPSLNKPDKKTGIAEMSRRKNIVSTWGLYRDALLEANLDPEDYEDMRLILTETERDLFRPLDIFRSETYQENLWRQMKAYLSRISDEESTPLMALGYACYNCRFKQLCRYRMEGWPTQELIDEMFIRKPLTEAEATPEGEESDID